MAFVSKETRLIKVQLALAPPLVSDLMGLEWVARISNASVFPGGANADVACLKTTV